MKAPLWIDEIPLSYPDAVAALTEALRGPDTTAGTPPRQTMDLAAGQLLLMPASLPGYAGVKVVTVAPGNPARGLPRINGIYVLFDGATLTPVALFDAAALTAVRTAAVSALAVDLLAAPDATRLVVFGAGPQAFAHVDAIGAVRPLRSVAVVARTPESALALVERVRRLGLAASAETADPPTHSAARRRHLDCVRRADIVACCTTAREPLFASSALPANATVVAVGSHEPDARELDAALIRRSTVIVESAASAATAGDIVLAGGFDLVDGDLTDLVAGRVRPEPNRPRVFKSVGEAWEDLVVAAAAYARSVGTWSDG